MTTPAPRTARVTILELRRQLREDKPAFLQAIDQLIEDAVDPDTRDFWRSLKAIAEKTP